MYKLLTLVSPCSSSSCSVCVEQFNGSVTNFGIAGNLSLSETSTPGSCVLRQFELLISQAYLAERGISPSGCLEKSDLVVKCVSASQVRFLVICRTSWLQRKHAGATDGAKGRGQVHSCVTGSVHARSQMAFSLLPPVLGF